MTMVAVRLGNFLYWLFIAILFVATFLSQSLCRRYGKDFAGKFILTILWTNFAFHFLKQLNPFYLADFPYSLKRSTPENLCALLILLAPFIFMWGGKHFKDYFFIVGTLSGLAVFFFPTEALNRPLDNAESLLEVSRFYLCHAPLVICPILMVGEGFHQLDYHRLLVVPLIFLGFETVIFINEILLKLSGLVNMDWVDLFSRNFRNGALVFGPPSSLDRFLGWLYVLIPPFLKYQSPSGILAFVPVLWLIVPLYLFGLPLGMAVLIPAEKRHMGIDLLTIRQKIKMRSLTRAYLKTK